MAVLKIDERGKWYGPYLRSFENGSRPRRQVILMRVNNTVTSMSYARYLMEDNLGRELLPDEHVDHVDNDPLNDVVENLQILSPAENNRKSNVGKWQDTCSRGHSDWKTTKAGRRICATCNRIHQETWRDKAGQATREPPAHGSKVMYSYHKCRCDMCRQGQRDRMRAQRAAKSR